MQKKIKSVVIIGSGNVATCMGKALHQADINVLGVYSKQLAHATALATQLNTQTFKQASDVPAKADLYILAVNDEAIKDVAAQLNVDGLIVHTSGSTSLDALAAHKRRGVFYALQTFKKDTQPDFANVPFLLEAASSDDLAKLKELASTLSKRILEVNSNQRLSLHVAAVFANNFTNHLFAVSRIIMEENNLPVDLLHPLMLQTVENAIKHDPRLMQTGPVVRKDMATVAMHLEQLQRFPAYRQLYELLSQSIRNLHEKKV